MTDSRANRWRWYVWGGLTAAFVLLMLVAITDRRIDAANHVVRPGSPVLLGVAFAVLLGIGVALDRMPGIGAGFALATSIGMTVVTAVLAALVGLFTLGWGSGGPRGNEAVMLAAAVAAFAGNVVVMVWALLYARAAVRWGQGRGFVLGLAAAPLCAYFLLKILPMR